MTVVALYHLMGVTKNCPSKPWTTSGDQFIHHGFGVIDTIFVQPRRPNRQERVMGRQQPKLRSLLTPMREQGVALCRIDLGLGHVVFVGI